LIEGNALEEQIDAALKQKIITQTQADQLSEFDRLTLDIINVDDFSEKELKTIR